MTDYGMDFDLVNATDDSGNTTLDVDLFTVLDNDPKVVQISDLNIIFASPGDYNWDPDTQSGTGLLEMRGQSLSSRQLRQIAGDLDTQSVSDSRVTSSASTITLQQGNLHLVHKITLDAGATFTSDILISGKSITTALGF